MMISQITPLPPPPTGMKKKCPPPKPWLRPPPPPPKPPPPPPNPWPPPPPRAYAAPGASIIRRTARASTFFTIDSLDRRSAQPLQQQSGPEAGRPCSPFVPVDGRISN